jgi:Tfp pilus assembly protein PilE
MKLPYSKNNLAKGFTLIEAIIYVALLSGLTSVFIPYAYSIHEQDMRILDQINSDSS